MFIRQRHDVKTQGKYIVFDSFMCNMYRRNGHISFIPPLKSSSPSILLYSSSIIVFFFQNPLK